MNLESKIHERRGEEQTLRENKAWLAGQREALEAALNSAPLETSLGVLVRTATDRLGQGARAAFYLANREGTTLHHVIGMPADYANAVDGFKISAESLSCGLAMHTGLPVLTSDVVKEPLWAPWLWMAQKADFRGCWSFPIRTTAGTFVGTFAVYWQQPREATSQDLELAALVTQAAAIIIARHTDAEMRREAEDALRESEQRLKLFIEHAPVAIAMFDQAMRYITASRRWLDDYGVTGDVIGRAHYEVFPEIPDNWKEVHRRGLAGEILHSEGDRFNRADGSVQWVKWDVRPWRTTLGEIGGILIATEDITDQKKAEEAVCKSEERLTLALAGGDLATWDWDIESGHVSFNERWARMREYEPSEIAPHVNSWTDGIHPDDLSVAKDTLDRYLTGQQATYECEMRVRTRSGGWRWILDRGKISARDIEGRPIRMSGTELDITERKRTEEALRDAQARLQRWNAELEEAVKVRTAELQESQQRLDLAQRAARIGSFDWNLHTGVNVWTPELEAMYGLKAGEFAGTQRAWEDFVHPDDRESAIAGVNHSLETGEPAEFEFRVVWQDGTIRWLLGRWQMFRANDGTPLRLTGVNLDITHRKKGEEELIQSQARLRALTTELNLAEQRERKRLAAELHDHLQQMLVLGKIQLSQAKRQAGGMPGCADLIKKVEDLLSDALVYTRTLVADLSPPVLSEHGLVAGLHWLAESMRKRNQVVTVVTLGPAEIRLPEDQMALLFQSVRELLINSWKYAGTEQATVTLEQSDAALRIVVSDQGRGFDPAATAAAAATGIPSGGLSSKFGLFSIQERMRALSGSFDIQSTPGHGTRATLTLPLKGFRQQKEICKKEAPNPSPASKVRVLLVDDHGMVREGLRIALEQRGDINVVGESWDGIDAVPAVEHLQPQVVVMDITMPNMNGIEATAHIKAACPQVHVIGLSLNVGRDNQEAMREAGADALLSKEADVVELYSCIVDAVRAGSGGGSP
jgi:PAS domain S-box-containing protein